MTPGVAAFYLISIFALVLLAMLWRSGRKVQEAKNTRHVISLPIGARFTMDDSDSIWVLIHLKGCGESVEWKGNFHPPSKHRHRQIASKDDDLRSVVVKVVQ